MNISKMFWTVWYYRAWFTVLEFTCQVWLHRPWACIVFREPEANWWVRNFWERLNTGTSVWVVLPSLVQKLYSLVNTLLSLFVLFSIRWSCDTFLRPLATPCCRAVWQQQWKWGLRWWAGQVSQPCSGGERQEGWPPGTLSHRSWHRRRWRCPPISSSWRDRRWWVSAQNGFLITHSRFQLLGKRIQIWKPVKASWFLEAGGDVENTYLLTFIILR